MWLLYAALNWLKEKQTLTWEAILALAFEAKKSEPDPPTDSTQETDTDLSKSLLRFFVHGNLILCYVESVCWGQASTHIARIQWTLVADKIGRNKGWLYSKAIVGCVVPWS